MSGISSGPDNKAIQDTRDNTKELIAASQRLNKLTAVLMLETGILILFTAILALRMIP